MAIFGTRGMAGDHLLLHNILQVLSGILPEIQKIPGDRLLLHNILTALSGILRETQEMDSGNQIWNPYPSRLAHPQQQQHISDLCRKC